MKSVRLIGLVLVLAVVACSSEPVATITTVLTTTSLLGTQPSTSAAATTSTILPSTTTTSTAELLEIVLDNGQPVGGAVTLEVRVGDQVEFIVVSNQDDELHVHGFDHYFELVANQPKLVSFDAAAHGIFDIETHRRHRLVVELVVR